MVFAVLSVVIGLLSFVAPTPVVAPVLGAALGANVLLKQRRLPAESQRTSVKVTAMIGALLCAVAVAMFFAARDVS